MQPPTSPADSEFPYKGDLCGVIHALNLYIICSCANVSLPLRAVAPQREIFVFGLHYNPFLRTKLVE